MITMKQVADEVRKLATEKPNNVYETSSGNCLYGYGECSDGSVGCLVGQALARLNLDVASLDDLENESCQGAGSACLSLGIESDKEFENWLDMVQSYQDSGAAWGDAVERADQPDLWDD